MVNESLVAWMVGIMMSTAPPGRAFPAEFVETKEDGAQRYAAIARSIAQVALDPNEEPVFGGELGRVRTAALLLSISYFESGWRNDVDLGLGGRARGDAGRSWCLMQVMVGNGRTAEGWTGLDLVASRERCMRAGLHLVRRSTQACRGRPVDQWLNAYASGRCEAGVPESRARMSKAKRWFSTYESAAPAGSTTSEGRASSSTSGDG
jgi:hypothetical protein